MLSAGIEAGHWLKRGQIITLANTNKDNAYYAFQLLAGTGMITRCRKKKKTKNNGESTEKLYRPKN